MHGFELLGRKMQVTGWREEDHKPPVDAMAEAEATAPNGGPPPGEISKCMVLHDVFDVAEELNDNGPDWADDIERDLREELQQHGTLTHFHMDRTVDSKGDVHVMYADDAQTLSAAKTLHRRFYGGSQILVEFLVESEYQIKFDLE